MSQPFSNDIIFLDSEFSDFNPETGELLSLGLVSSEGEELYIEIEYQRKVHPWVEKHVLPNLNGQAISRSAARNQLETFIKRVKKSTEKPYLMAYVNQFDAIYWYKLFGSPKEQPMYWIPIDFASILFGLGFDPNSLGKKEFFLRLGINKDEYRLHNALDDARLLRRVYQEFVKKYLNNVV